MKRRYMFLGIALILIVGLGFLGSQIYKSEWGKGITIHNLPGSMKSAVLMPSDDKNPSPYYEVVFSDGQGTEKSLTPSQFAQELLKKEDNNSFLLTLLNISTPYGVAWVVLGLLGQVLFTGRMILQWLVSEKHKKSVVPPAFWWMSLIGASMLITYFIWRKDIVGFLGQATGWLIYTRNLWLIYRPGSQTDHPSESND